METLPNTFPVLEATTPRYRALLVQEDGVTPLPGSLLSTLTLTLYYIDATGQHIINGRNAQNVLNANGVTIDEDGILIYIGSAADTEIFDDSLPSERHYALFEWSWGLTPFLGKHEVIFAVRNLQQVP